MNYKPTIEFKCAVIHLVVGSIVGFISSLLTSNWVILLMMLVVLFATGQVAERILKYGEEKTPSGEKKYGGKWWLSNGVWPYIIFWLFVWIIFYNI